MAECPQEEDDLAITTPGYKPPAQKSLADIQNLDAEDESLRRYKESLLGNVAALPADGDDRTVILLSLSVIVDGRDDISLDLTGDLSKLKNTPIVLKEGTRYKLKVTFRCPREIVSGLRFITSVHRMNVKVSTLNYMVGSYGPPDVKTFTTSTEEAPSGMLARGQYTARSTFLDDDENIYLKWQWTLDIKKHWPDEKQ